MPPRTASYWSLEDFDVYQELYQGKFSTVHSCSSRRSGMPLALKCYDQSNMSPLNLSQAVREVSIHSKLSHRNIVKMYGSFQHQENLYMVQELMDGGDLFSHVKSMPNQTASEQYVAVEVLPDLLSALDYLHTQCIAHRDIKPENILMSSEGLIKLADFGLAIDANEERLVTRAGTLDYMAPEVLLCPDKKFPEEHKDRADLAYTSQVDVWACGILVYELLVGKAPFEKDSRLATYNNILEGEPVYPDSLSVEARDFIQWTLCKDARERPTMQQLRRHKWLTPVEQKEKHGCWYDHEPSVSSPTLHRSRRGSAVTYEPKPPPLLDLRPEPIMSELIPTFKTWSPCTSPTSPSLQPRLQSQPLGEETKESGLMRFMDNGAGAQETLARLRSTSFRNPSLKRLQSLGLNPGECRSFSRPNSDPSVSVVKSPIDLIDSPGKTKCDDPAGNLTSQNIISLPTLDPDGHLVENTKAKCANLPNVFYNAKDMATIKMSSASERVAMLRMKMASSKDLGSKTSVATVSAQSGTVRTEGLSGGLANLSPQAPQYPQSGTERPRAGLLLRSASGLLIGRRLLSGLNSSQFPPSPLVPHRLASEPLSPSLRKSLSISMKRRDSDLPCETGESSDLSQKAVISKWEYE